MAGVKTWYILTVNGSRLVNWQAYNYLAMAYRKYVARLHRELFDLGKVAFAPKAPGNWRKKIVRLRKELMIYSVDAGGRLQELKARDPWKSGPYKQAMAGLGVPEKRKKPIKLKTRPQTLGTPNAVAPIGFEPPPLMLIDEVNPPAPDEPTFFEPPRWNQ